MLLRDSIANKLLCAISLFGDIVRHSERYRKTCSLRGKESQRVQLNTRLSAALDHRSIKSCLVFEIDTHNPRTGQRHQLEIRHDPGNGNNRYSLYIDGVRTRKQWSRTGFTEWLFGKIDSVVNFS